ncbi:Bug family tripartite tricarboxylate transporter substrate binding protein [Aquabacterium sp.]|uniref:Bug family tripartite tricarboxylate transporter substrate binding protein n=1 Tax=Aquabacterium sp. TaxID=1872578 RepID=UPI002C5C78E5|nr:tripartite tricarboxylate transporter substrate-binding protein [Aquabacterium sp.]HSW06468.1 tripartite tricarboxylate transporter substrate-binding protein [Aquabacterium sp.]
MKPVSLLAMAAAALVAVLPPAAAQSYPSKAVTLVVPFPPGGGTDIVARLVAVKLAARLGQAVVVENKPGAATAIGAGAVAKAAPDGYTLLLSGSSTYSIVPALRAGLPYDPLASFSHIAVVAKAPLVLLASPAAQAASTDELLKRAKATPDGLMFATFGNGSGPHFAGAMLADAAHVKFTAIPYKGSAPALTGLIGGEVAFTFDTVAAGAPHVRAGKLKALAVTGDKRSELLPEVPTYAEAGLAKASLVSWYGLVAPAKTPEAVLSRLTQELTAVMADTEVRKTLAANGLDAAMLGREAFQQLIRKEMAEFKDIAQRASITLD